MLTSNGSTTNNLVVAWGDSNPPEFITLYEITTPLEKFIAIGHTVMVGMPPLFYWSNPDPLVMPGFEGYTLRIYPFKDKEAIEKRLAPAVIVTQKIYLPRFHEDKWRKSNRISLASV